jgi:hypothetical protein
MLAFYKTKMYRQMYSTEQQLFFIPSHLSPTTATPPPLSPDLRRKKKNIAIS